MMPISLSLCRILALLSVVAGFSAVQCVHADTSDGSNTALSASGERAVGASAGSLADLVEKLTPAVVNISTTQKLPERRQGHGTPHDLYQDFFEQFGIPPGLFMPFGLEDEGAPGGGIAKQVTSLGSGFIIDASGLIVTNHHVVEGADEITVTLSDETQLKAEVIGTDPKTDLALLKVKSKTPLPFVTFDRSAKIRVGDPIVAIGNPFGLGGTVTSGIISGLNRNINAGAFDNFLQTDAAINKGNSGGPMFNMQGEVIGINTAIVSPSGGSVGVGFAIPSSLARSVIEQLQDKGKVRRGLLGVMVQPLTEEMAESLGLQKDRGAAVSEVVAGGPAEKAGIQTGDIILSVDGIQITKHKRLPGVVAETPIGKQVKIEVYRNGKVLSLNAVMGEMPEEVREGHKSGKQDAPLREEGAGETASINDMTVATLNPTLRDRFKIDAQLKGLVVLSVKKASHLAMVGIKRGDVIVAMNQQSVETVAAAKAVVAHAEKEKRQNLLLTVRRQNQTILVAVPLLQK